jgi:hypothetical protein
MSQPQSETTFQCRFSIDYLKTVNGILKIVEIVLSIIAFACSTATSNNNYYWSGKGGYGWVSFVTITGFIQAIISLIMHLLFVMNWKWNTLLELITYGVWTVLLLIAGIVAAACAHPYLSTTGAAAAFTFFAMVAWAIDTGFQAQHVRVNFSSSSTTATTTHTTTVNTTERFEGNPQY